MIFSRPANLQFLLLALMIFAGQASADSWQQTVSSQFSTEFDTNPAMSPTYTGGIWRSIFEPGYSLEGRLGDSELKTGLAVQIARSSNATLSPNRDSPSVFLDWLRQSEAGEFSIRSRYAETSTRDAAIDVSSQVPADSTRASRTLSGRWSKALSERSTFTADSSYEGVSYKGANSTYVDYSSRTNSLMMNYIWDEHYTPFLQILHTDYQPVSGNFPNSFTTTVLAGLNWRASETLEGSLQYGKSRISDAEMSSQGGMTIQYTDQRSVYYLSANRQVAPGGLGGFITTDQVNGSWTYDLSERSKSGINAGWRKNHFVTDIISRTAGAWLQYDLDSFWALRTYYMRNMISAEGIDDAYSNILGISLSYTNTDF